MATDSIHVLIARADFICLCYPAMWRIIAMLIQKTFTENKQLITQIAGDVEALCAEERKVSLDPGTRSYEGCATRGGCA